MCYSERVIFGPGAYTVVLKSLVNYLCISCAHRGDLECFGWDSIGSSLTSTTMTESDSDGQE